MTAEQMAALHSACFTVPRPWSAMEFSGLLASPLCFALGDAQGFALGRVVAGEAELLTLAVDPLRRRQGIGAELLHRFLAEARARGGESAFLEVIEDNHAAQGLYAKAGFTKTGLRRGYYQSPGKGRSDAVVMSRKI